MPTHRKSSHIHVVRFRQWHRDDIEVTAQDANLDGLVKEALIESEDPMSLDSLWQQLENVADSKIKLVQSLQRLFDQGDIQKAAKTDSGRCLYAIAAAVDEEAVAS